MDAHKLSAWIAALFLSASLFSHTVALRLVLLVAGAAAVGIVIAKGRPALRIVPPLWLPFALWAAWSALSIAWAIEPERAVKEWRNEIAYAALAFWMCFVAAQAPRAPRILLPVLALAAAAVSAVALYYFPQGVGAYSHGWHGGAGNHSSALLTLMPGAVMAAWYARRSAWNRWVPWLCFLLAVLFAVSAYTTLNRTVWAGFALQFLIMGALLLRRARIVLDMRTTAIGAAAALAVVAGAALMTLGVQAEREANGAARSFTQDPRFPLWIEIAERVEARPLTGYGFGRGALRESLRVELDDQTVWHSHNLLLDSVIQLGFPGLLLLLLLLAATARAGWRLARDRSDAAAACGIALIAVLAGMVMRNMTDVLWVRQNALLYWGVAGVLLAWGSSQRHSPD
jgi:O-antigen ligase